MIKMKGKRRMQAVDKLSDALFENPLGLCGEHEAAQIAGEVGDLERRLHALTLGAVMDVFPVAERWTALAALEEDWLLDSSQAAYKKSQEVGAAMQAGGVGGPKHNARVWWQVCRGLQGRFKGSVRGLIRENGDDALAIQSYLNESKTTFPVLSGPVISARWLDLVHRIGEVRLKNWGELKVTLPPELKQAAGQFGLKDDEAHPKAAAALDSWKKACRKLDAEVCGLGECPRR